MKIEGEGTFVFKELIIDEYGMSLSKKSERMVLKKNGKVVEEFAIKELDDLIITTKCGSISVALMEELIGNGTQVHFINYRQEPFLTMYTPAHHGAVKGRRQQLLSYEDERGVELVKEMIFTKVHNQINTVKVYLKNRQTFTVKADCEQRLRRMDEIKHKIKTLQGSNITGVRDQLRNLEALAAKYYWYCVKHILQKKIEFKGRKPRSQCAVNMMFDYGYAILRAKVSSALIRSGLELYGGFLHTDRSGKPSLVLDVMEMYRQPVVDRAVISLLTKGLKPTLSKAEGGSPFLNQYTLQKLRKAIMNRFHTIEQFEGKKYKLQTIIQLQGRSLSSYFRENTPFYGFKVGW